LRFAEFERVARDVWNDIPSRFKSGVDGLIVDQGARPHEDDPEVFTVGECVTEEFPSDYGGPDTIRSAVVLYYGSFRAVAAEDEFDWREEIHETILHELQHHLESLATEDSLEDVDYAVNENFKRARGEDFDPLFYRAGVGGVVMRLGGHAVSAFEVEGDVFVELPTSDRNQTVIEWEWEGSSYRASLPSAEADVTYHYIEEGPDIGDRDFCIVRVVHKGVLSTLRAALGRGHTVEEVMVKAERSE
jgi:predicted Zn-dependent protease with MMP-like domain